MTNDDRPSWFTFRAYWYGDLDALILGVMPQCLAMLSGRHAHFTRHWARGPHLCLHFTGVDDEMHGIMTALTAVFKQYHPPEEHHISPATREVSERLAAREQYGGLVWPPLAHGHISIEARQRSSGLKNGQAAEDIIDQASHELNEVVINLIAQGKDGNNLHDLCFQLMLTTIHYSCPDVSAVNGFLSYRSHAELFLTEVPDEYRVRFESVYSAHAQALHRLAEHVFQDHTPSETFTIWKNVFQSVYRRAQHALESGQLDLSWEGQDFDVQSPSLTLAAERSKRSAFHRIELANPTNLRLRSQDTLFNAFRIILNVQYLQLTRLGLMPLHRALLCHLCANTVEHQFGVNGLEMISRYSYSQSQDSQ